MSQHVYRRKDDEEKYLVEWESATSLSLSSSSAKERFFLTTDLEDFENAKAQEPGYDNEREDSLASLLKREDDEKKANDSMSSVDNLITFNQQDSESLRKVREAHDFEVVFGSKDKKTPKLIRHASVPNETIRIEARDFSEPLNPFGKSEFEEGCDSDSSLPSLWSVSTSPNSPISFYKKGNQTTNLQTIMAAEGDRHSLNASRGTPNPYSDENAELDQTSDEKPIVKSVSQADDDLNYHDKPSITSEEKLKKKKKKLRGLPLPVRAFKSREERDPEAVNQDLRVNFTDVIAEPEGFYTPKFSWNLSQEVYGFGKGCCYSCATFFCGIPLSFVWGIWFALLACLNVWCLVPLKRCNSIKMSCWKGFWGVLISSCCDPVYESMGMIFSKMNVRTEKYIV